MSYATQAQANLLLTTEPWILKSSTDKQLALDIATTWIDDKYSCVADDPVQSNLVRANILLADKFVNGNLFVIKEGVIKSKMVDADGVVSSKEYSEGTQEGANPYAEIELLIGSVCSIASSLSLVSRRV